MLTDAQQTKVRRALEEWVFDLTKDPVRVDLDSLHNLQVSLAGAGVTIDLITSFAATPAPTSTPTSGSPPEYLYHPPRPILPTPAPALAAVKLTPSERGVLITAEMAADSMRHNQGYSFRSDTIFGLTKIIRRIADEPKS